jgi:uncharacterized protein YkwD
MIHRLVFRSLLCVAVVALAACDTRITAPRTSSGTPATSLSNGLQGIVDGTNAERARYGLPPLSSSATLNHAADLTSAQLVKTGVVAHDIAGATYPTPTDRFRAAGYVYTMWGENIGRGAPGTTVTAMNAAWIASSDHHANMVSTSYTQIGVSIATAADGTVYMVQEFGHP